MNHGYCSQKGNGFFPFGMLLFWIFIMFFAFKWGFFMGPFFWFFIIFFFVLPFGFSKNRSRYYYNRNYRSLDQKISEQQVKEPDVMTSIQYCSNCGEKIDSDANFCLKCGFNLKN